MNMGRIGRASSLKILERRALERELLTRVYTVDLVLSRPWVAARAVERYATLKTRGFSYLE